jgi:hypothetical protein
VRRRRLIESPDFTTSIYEPDEAAFGSNSRDALVAAALSLAAQGRLGEGIGAPRLQYGLSMTRYNRVEGLSTGLLVQQQLGGGYVATAQGRFGFADREPNGELTLARTNLARTIALTGYHRLVSSGDWGRPLSFSASVPAFLFGRDEGFYHRASGAELSFRTERFLSLDWRLFGERQRPARQETGFSVFGDFVPNIAAARTTSAGAAVRWTRSHGLDPRGFRTLTDVRLEGAGGDSTYGRGAVDVTLSHGLPLSLTGALTLAGGSTVGGVPPQRRWYLGGSQTSAAKPRHGAERQRVLASRARARPRHPRRAAHDVGDLGWAGDRTRLSSVGRPLAGVGVGASVLDGRLRLRTWRAGCTRGSSGRVDLSLGRGSRREARSGTRYRRGLGRRDLVAGCGTTNTSSPVPGPRRYRVPFALPPVRFPPPASRPTSRSLRRGPTARRAARPTAAPHPRRRGAGAARRARRRASSPCGSRARP